MDDADNGQATPAPPAREPSAAQIKAAGEIRKMVAKTVHDTFLLRDGRANAAMTKTRASRSACMQQHSQPTPVGEKSLNPW